MAEFNIPACSDRSLSALSPLEQEISTLFAKRILERMGARVLAMRIFGSRARGEAREDSDLDIWVLLDRASLQDRNEISDIGTDLMLEMLFPFQVAPRVMSQQDYEQLRALERLFPRELEKDGIEL
ncbi:MAG: nucleotidyltransferase domain-containing protein [Candidatus Eremiobacteraeota bacterium]|nr:nucleotidyltransferase domain-containing protein [Candidatus Eremiobacteraeota bacterium]